MTTDTNFIRIAPSLIAPSLTNPRKTFNVERLAELAESIRTSGVHSPLLLRPLPADRLQDTFTNRAAGAELPTHELVTGERRLRASIMAEQATVPALVRDLTDDEVLEIQIIENLQRDDLSELEEAEGYEMLMQHGHNTAYNGERLTVDQVAAKIGKSRSYVYARLKLLDLCPDAREQMRAGKLDASKALLVARIPDHKLQTKAVNALVKPNWQGDQMSFRAASDWLRQNVMLKLTDAPFKTKDENLVPAAGSCNDCPKRTGASPELFTDIDSPDVCTDTKCYQKKVDAHTDKLADKARAKGLEVISGKEAKEMKPSSWSSPKGVEDLDRVIWIHSDDAEPEQKSLRSALTKEELQGQVKALIDPHTHKVIEIIPTQLAAVAEERLRQSSEKKGPLKQMIERQQAQAALDLEKRYHTMWRERAHQVIEPRVIAEEINRFQAPMLRALLAWMTSDPEFEALERAVDKPDLEDYEAMEAEIALLPDERLGITILRALLARERTVGYDWNNGARVMVLEAPVITSCAEVLGIDLEAIRGEVKAELQAEQEEKARLAAEKAAKASSTDAPAAQASGVRGGKDKKPKPAGAAPRKAKTTPEEALQGIAAAMQNGEESAASTAKNPGAADAAQGDEGTADDGGASQGGSDDAASTRHPHMAWPFPRHDKRVVA